MKNQTSPTHPQQSEMQKLSTRWGISSAEFYSALRDRPVKITAVDSKSYSGVLVGIDQYDLIFRPTNGLVVLFPKHSVKYLHADSSASGSTINPVPS